ncbi:hypothetical protein BJ742DRAFT_457742 [Cladochytrium replicatum]|nr:hypothetical protein BJ742DRAFT_457742 [Cladochytrium replicatum]
MERRYTRRHAPSGSQRRKNCGSMDFGIDTIPSGEESCVKGSRFGSGRRGEGALPIDAIHDSPWTSAQELLSPAQAGRPVSKGATRLVSMLEPPMATGAGLPRINAAGGGLTTGGVLEKPIAVDRNGIKPRAPSWYTKSLYVQERQHLQPRKIKKRTPMPVISTTRGAYHALQPRELSEFVEIRVPPFLSHGRKATMTESGLNPLPH